jgi:hypothetical protein
MNKIVRWAITDWGYKIALCCGATVIFIGTYTALYTSSTKKEDHKPVVQDVQVAPITEDQMLDSMVRAWTDTKGMRFKKVCHDAPAPNNKDGFFILYGPKNPGDGDEMLEEGWWYVEQEFFRTSAGKYYTNDVPTLDRKFHVYPDVTGLNCKDR